MIINQRKLSKQNIFARLNKRVSMPMLFDLIWVKHFRMHRDRKRHSAAASVIYVYGYVRDLKCIDVVCAGPDHG